MPDGRERFTQIRPAATLLLSVDCLYQMNEKNCKGEFFGESGESTGSGNIDAVSPSSGLLQTERSLQVRKLLCRDSPLSPNVQKPFDSAPMLQEIRTELRPGICGANL